jgi:hypothetical protein
MSAIRNYVNQLKDDTEAELYNIRWENLAKPLQEKLNGLDKEIVANSDSINQIQANFITADQIASKYVTSEYLESDFIYTKTLNASQITAGKINTTVFNASMLEAQYINASNQIKTSKLDATVITTSNLSAQSINVDQLTGGYIDATHIDAESIRTGLVVADNLYTTGDVIASGHLSASIIAGKFTSSESALFDRINISMASLYDTGLRMHMGATYAQVYLKSYASGKYYLAVDMPY